MKFELKPIKRNIDEKALIDDLRRVAEEKRLDKVTVKEYNAHGKYNAATFKERFGSWHNALDMAGLKQTRTRQNLSKDELFSNLAEVWLAIGHQPSYKEMEGNRSKYGPKPYERQFGSWRSGLEAFVEWANSEGIEAPKQRESQNPRRTPRLANWRLRAQVLMRDGATCRMCGARPEDGVKLHVDHIIPWANGGETVLENLQILCEQCNIGKSDLSPGSHS